MNNAEDFYNELYYIYKDKYNKEISNLNTTDKKKISYKKLKPTDNYYESEDEEASQAEKLAKWIKVSEKRFNEILNTITEAKNNGLKANINGKEITLDKQKITKRHSQWKY